MADNNATQVFVPNAVDLVVLCMDPTASVAHLKSPTRTQQMAQVSTEGYLAYVAMVRSCCTQNVSLTDV